MFLNGYYSSIQLRIDENRETAKKYSIVWPPGLLFLDSKEREHYKRIGYQPPHDLLALLKVATGKCMLFNINNLNKAMDLFTDAEENYTDTPFAAEAMYWKGIGFYRQGHKDKYQSHWRELASKYPQTYWGKAASFLAVERGA